MAVAFVGVARLLEAREKLYELLTNCIPADVILKVRKACLSHWS